MELLTTNGHAPNPAGADAGWRQRAIERALRCASNDGTPQFALLDAVHRHLPGCAARIFHQDRNRTLEALAGALTDFLPVFTPVLNGNEGSDPSPVYGWWRGTLPPQKDPVEVVLSPCLYGEGSFVIAGPDEADVGALVERIIAEVTRPRGRCLRYAGRWQDAPEIEAETDKVGWDDIVLPAAQLADIRRTIAAFFAQKHTFAALGFPWRRGILLVGPPGTGKTMVCKAAAATYPNAPFLYVRDLSTHGMGDAIARIFGRARALAAGAPGVILAFEDVDGLVDKTNRTVFLNELDGFRCNDGLLIIASSNHPERIDEALLKRPSRFDRVYHIGLPEFAERAEFCRRLLARTPGLSPDLDVEALVRRAAELTVGFTPAFLKEAFLSALLQMAQEGLTVLDEAFGAAVLEQIDALRQHLKKTRDPLALSDLTTLPGEGIGFRSR